MPPEAVTAITGLLSLIVTAAAWLFPAPLGQRTSGPSPSRNLLKWRQLGMASGLTVAATTLAVLAWLSINPPTRIENPEDGFTTTDNFVDVLGTAKAPADSRQLWLVVQPLDQGSYYPWMAITPRNNRWSGRVGIGPKKIKKDNQFIIMIVDATRDAVIEIHRGRSDPKFNLHGMPALPSGVQTLDTIGVNRKVA
jgi:hypothetical protein